MSSLKLTNLNKVFPSGETALHNINLEAQDKEFLVLLGGENSGKSTLLRIIAGLEDATSGELLIDGKDMTDVEPKNRDIAMVFKNGTLYPALNVFDNMAFGLRLRKAPEALVRERVKTVAEILGLNDVLYRKPKVLTSAMKQRVAIGRAIVREPKLYLFDDPFSGLDEKLRLDMLNLVINLQARMEGTFVYSAKNLAEAMTIGTRIALLKDGLLQQVDTPSNLYDYPANTYVAFYIGSPTINFVKRVKIVSEAVAGEGENAETRAYYGVCKDLKLRLPQNIVDRFTAVAEYADKDRYVTLGIRPEDAKIDENGDIKATVCKVEGEEEKYAECDVNPDICLNVSTDKDYNKGESVSIFVDLSHLYIFDGASCLTLLERDAGYKVTGLPNADFVPLPYDEEQKLISGFKPKKEKKKK